VDNLYFPIRFNIEFPIRFNIELRVYSGAMTPDRVARILGVDGSSAISREPLDEPVGAAKFHLAKVNGWFLSSEDRVESRDPRRHID
jgi:hypothetical protein